jgi:hypothetical protein
MGKGERNRTHQFIQVRKSKLKEKLSSYRKGNKLAFDEECIQMEVIPFRFLKVKLKQNQRKKPKKEL